MSIIFLLVMIPAFILTASGIFLAIDEYYEHYSSGGNTEDAPKTWTDGATIGEILRQRASKHTKESA